MSKTMNWPARATYIAIALALALSLVVVAAPKVSADPGLTEWSPVKTPSMKDWVVAPGSEIFDFAMGPDGDTIYAVGVGLHKNELGEDTEAQLWKSGDGGTSWRSLNKDLPDTFDAGEDWLYLVSVAPDDADFVVVAGWDWSASDPIIYGSDDGGDHWSATAFAVAAPGEWIYCLDISAERDDAHGIAVGTDFGLVWLYEAGAVWGGVWRDTTLKDGWDIGVTGITSDVTSVAFSPNWAVDDTILAITTDGLNTYQQSGIWGITKAWNVEAGAPFPPAVMITDAPPLCWWNWTLGALPSGWDQSGTGIALPSDFTGYDGGLRENWVYVNYDTADSVNIVPDSFDNAFEDVGQVFRIKGRGLKYAGVACEQWDTTVAHPLLASISMYGEIDDGNLIVGLLGEPEDDFDADPPVFNGDPTKCCKGVQVFRTLEWPIDYCCPQWADAKKAPTGKWNAVVGYTPDGKKAYAATSGDNSDYLSYDFPWESPADYVAECDESAFSLSEVDEVAKFWNQPSLVDTWIDYLSDMAVNPACGTIYLFSINEDCTCWNQDDTQATCDSVWMSTNNGDSYLRVFCKALANDWGLIRLAPEEEKTVDTVYLVDWYTKDIWWNDDSGLTSWASRIVSTLDDVADLAVESEDTIYAVSSDGEVSTSDKHGGPGSWSRAKKAKLTQGEGGHTIAVLDGHVLVGGDEGTVTYSDDSADSFSPLGKDNALGGLVHVAFDSYFKDNDTVYAAVTNGKHGIWRWVIGKQRPPKWTNLEAEHPDDGALDYTGIVLDNAKGNPMTKAATGGVLYAAYERGVARCLTPAAEVCCGAWDWDFLEAGLPPPTEGFLNEPSSLKICGCLTSASNSNLFAIDSDWYDITGRASPPEGIPWSYEDCFAKAGVDLSAVKDGAMVAADPCICANEKFVLAWERLCNECEYDLQIALDEDFSQIVLEATDIEAAGDGGFYDPPKNAAPSIVIGEGDLDCNTEYFWRVRTRYAETDDAIRSWWSDTWSFTVEAGPMSAIDLTAPEDGATGVALTGIGFTWTSVVDADTYDFVLSGKADLSSPIETKTGLKGTAYTYTGKLDNSTSYFWRVTAMKGGNVFSQSNVGTFTTAAKVVPPPPPVEVTTYPPAPPQPTPFWVWIVIGIGAVLVIVVIVLIFRTRRV